MPDTKDFTKIYTIDLEEDGETVTYPCEIISFNTTTELYTISVRGLGTVLVVSGDKITEI